MRTDLLWSKTSGQNPEPGDELLDFRGETWIFVQVIRLPEPGRTGKVEVHLPGDTLSTRVFYSEVFPDLEWAEVPR